jgi:hypothetical protein
VKLTIFGYELQTFASDVCGDFVIAVKLAEVNFKSTSLQFTAYAG